MALDPRIALMGQMPQFSLLDWGQVMRSGQRLQADQLTLSEEQRRLAEADAIRQAYAQQYGGSAPAGLAGVTPMPDATGAATPVQERQLGGAPSAAFPGGQAPPGGPQAPQGLAGLQGQMAGAAGAPGPPAAGGLGQQRDFINTLYTISPVAGREAEKHAYTTQELQMKANLERVEYLGRVADGVLEANTQQAYDVGRAMLIEQGMPPAQLPVTYDPQLMRFYSTTAKDSKDRYNEALVQVAQAKEQRERSLAASKAPDYGYGDEVNAALYARYGAQIPPGSPPTPAMVQQAQQDVQQGTLTLEKEKAVIGAGAKAPEQLAQREKELRGEFTSLTKDYRTVSDAYGRIQASAKDPSAAGDLALIFSYMKLLDPGSTVREGEFATAATAGSVPERVIAQYNRLLTSGERLSDAMKADFVDRAQRLYDQSTKDYQKTKTQYEGLARRYGAEPANVTLDFGTTAERTAPSGGGAKKRSPYAGMPVEQLTPDQLREERDFLRANP